MNRAVIIGALGAATVLAVIVFLPLFFNSCGVGPDGVRVIRLPGAPAERPLQLNETHFAAKPQLRTILDASDGPSRAPEVRVVNNTTIEYPLDRASSRDLFAYLEARGQTGAHKVVEREGRSYELEFFFLMC